MKEDLSCPSCIRVYLDRPSIYCVTAVLWPVHLGNLSRVVYRPVSYLFEFDRCSFIMFSKSTVNLPLVKFEQITTVQPFISFMHVKTHNIF